MQQRRRSARDRLKPFEVSPPMANSSASVKFPSLTGTGRAYDYQSSTRPTIRTYTPSDPADDWPARMDADVLALVESSAEANAATVVPVEMREWVRKNCSVRAFYSRWIEPERIERRRAGTLSTSSIAHDRQAIRHWEKYTRPDNWPAGKDWPGWPIGAITAKRIDQFLVRLYASVPKGTASSTWSHLRTIFNSAQRTGGIEDKLRPTCTPKAEDTPVEIFSAEQLEAAYRALAEWPDLQVAFVLACNVGARTVDLFLLRWDRTHLDGSRPTITFTAKKTGKTQTIPLAPVTVAQLKRLPSRGASEWLFPGRSSPGAKDPEHARPSIRRRAIYRTAFAAAGITFPKPFQSLRKTCSTRLEAKQRGAGEFVLGHERGVNARYTEPAAVTFDAINAIPQPAVFFDFAG